MHSHEFRSPLTGQQEVSAFGTDGVGDESDDFKVVCTKGTTWLSGEPFYLQHAPTKRFLAASEQARFTQQNCPVSINRGRGDLRCTTMIYT